MTADVADIVGWLRAQRVRDLHLDSRAIAPGDAFVAVPGAKADGRRFVAAAVARGAVAVLVEADGWAGAEAGVPVRAVPRLAARLGVLGADWYGRPSDALVSIGVTGTNGKTSCSQWIAQALTLHGQRCGVIGTVGSGFPGALDRDAALTTPDPLSLQREVRRLADAGARALAMEVSSIGLDQDRVAGMTFDVAVFTNLTRDHLDYHGTMAAYEAAKARLFAWPTLRHAIVNLDDAMGRRLAMSLAPQSRITLTGYTVQDAPAPDGARVMRAADLRATAEGLGFTLTAAAESHRIAVPLVGQFNASNLLAVVGALCAAGVPLAAAVSLLPHLAPPPGRMQRVAGGAPAAAPLAVVDYAHTPDALAQALAALRPVAQARGGALWVVFGAGGDRDPGKRAPMGAAAAAADRIVVTSDNPRSEEPASIVAEVGAGVPPGRACEQIVDRAQAIGFAIAAADARDVVLIAGKGHEDYQELRGVRLPFSDAAQAQAALAARADTHRLPQPPSAPRPDHGGAPEAPTGGTGSGGGGGRALRAMTAEGWSLAC